jgi:predicted DNA-binding transcriptional regulator YafY
MVKEIRWHATQRTENLPGGRVLFRATVSGLEEVRYWVLGFGPAAQVRKPKELANEVRVLAKKTADLYEQG